MTIFIIFVICWGLFWLVDIAKSLRAIAESARQWKQNQPHRFFKDAA